MLRAAANSGGVEERCSGGGERRDEEGGGGVDDGPSLEEVLNMSKYSNLLRILLLEGSAANGADWQSFENIAVMLPNAVDLYHEFVSLSVVVTP